MGSRALRLAAITAALALLGLGHAEFADAAAGDVLRDVPAGTPGGVSVAFDGKNLYYTDRNGVMLKSVTPAGSARPSMPIVGAAGLNALTYDVTHDFFWGVDSTGLGVYQLTRDGTASLQFVLLPAVDLPGLCDIPTGCSTVVSGLAYDATDDSLWYAPQGSQRTYHFTTAGQLIGYFDTNETSGSLFPDCLTNGVSGVAAGANSLYVAAEDCAKGFRYAKSDSQTALKLSTFKAPTGSGDLECDNVTFSTTVVWIRSVVDGHLRAVEVAAGTCAFGGGLTLNRADRWMSGGGEGFAVSDNDLPVQHAFHLLCDQVNAGPPNNMVANWKGSDGVRYSFHLNTVTTIECFNNGMSPDPPPCQPSDIGMADCFNTIRGEGTGRLTGRDGARIVAGSAGPNNDGFLSFRFTDAGEPNRADDGNFEITDMRTGYVLVVCGCRRANYQAHQRDR